MGHGKRTHRKSSGSVPLPSFRASPPLEARVSPSPGSGSYTLESDGDSTRYSTRGQRSPSNVHISKFPIASLVTAVTALALTAASYYGVSRVVNPKLESARREAVQAVYPIQSYLEATLQDPSLLQVQGLPEQLQSLRGLIPVDSSSYPHPMSNQVGVMLQRAQGASVMYSPEQPEERNYMCDILLPDLSQGVKKAGEYFVDGRSSDLKLLQVLGGIGCIATGTIGLIASGIFFSGLRKYYKRS